MLTEQRQARAQAMRCVGEQRGECALDSLRLARQIDQREHEAGILYRTAWQSGDPAARAICSVIDQELERRVDYDAPFILRCATVHRAGAGVAPRSSEGLARLRRCLSRAAVVIETFCGELKIAAD